MKTPSAHVRNLLSATAVIEVGAGVALLLIPSRAAIALLGEPLGEPAALIVARVAAAALLALGVACWLARNHGQSGAARGLIRAMLIYNGAVAAVLALQGSGAGSAGIVLWSAVVLHVALGVWCVVSLKDQPAAP